MTYAERVKEKADFLKECGKYGFDPSDYQRSFKHFAKIRHGKYTFLSLIGFTEGGRCILEINDPTERSKKRKREYVLPSDCMRFMRLYYSDMAYEMREKKEYDAARTYDNLVKLMTKKLEKIGYNAHPTDLFNVYGSSENATLNLSKSNRVALIRTLGKARLSDMRMF